jgi:NTP pyrophosphatase (non-canonical NTP hydrolase)
MTESEHDIIRGVMAEIQGELIRATKKHGPMHSAHEAYGVIAEEFYEFLVAMHMNDLGQMRHEATQVAAMCARFLVDVGAKDG